MLSVSQVSVTFTIWQNKIAKIVSGTVQYSKQGWTVIDLSIVCPNKANLITNPTSPQTLRDTIYISYTAPTDIATYNNNSSIEVFPNPTNGQFTIKSDAIIETLTITDLAGNVVLNSNINQNQTLVDLSSQAAGVYFIKTSGNNVHGVQKVVVVK